MPETACNYHDQIQEGTDQEKDSINEDEDEIENYEKIIFGVEDVPAPQMCIMLAVQHVVLCISCSLSIPVILSTLLCAGDQDDVKAQLFCITIFMSGLATVLQTTIGFRAGIVQGASFMYISPIIAMMSLDTWRCPDLKGDANSTSASNDDAWKIRMREIQGNLMLASLTQVILGCTGFIGFCMRFIGPLTIAPTITLIGLSLTDAAASLSEVNWGIAMLTVVIIVVSSLLLGNFQIPIPSFSIKLKCHIVKYRIFLLIPILVSVCMVWMLCFVLTISDVFPNNSTEKSYFTRTDARLAVLEQMPWFYFPVPLQFGIPTVSVAGFVGMLAATLGSIMESIGDYFATARISEIPAPPPHALNRGIATEGFASIISGLVGAGHGTTTYTPNIGVIGITKCASRRVFQVTGIMLLLCGVLGKFGAVLTLIPVPIIGGVFTYVIGMVTGMGITVLQFVDITSIRNGTILSLSITLGLMFPKWIQNNLNSINTGSNTFDQMLNVLLGTAIFVGGATGFILDNIIPGTKEERGLLEWQNKENKHKPRYHAGKDHYEIPYITKYLRRIPLCFWIPFSPAYGQSKDTKDDTNTTKNECELLNNFGHKNT